MRTMRSFHLKAFSLGFLVPLFLLGGCASVVPRELRKEVDRSISFEEIKMNPDAYLGRMVLLGGEIIETENLPDETQLEMLQKPLGDEDMPVDTGGSEGRFLISYAGYLDPAVYSGGRYVTAVGEVLGSKSLKIGEAEYQAPIISGKFLHLWPQTLPYYGPDYYGPFSYPYYYPYYYPYSPYGGLYFSWFGWPLRSYFLGWPSWSPGGGYDQHRHGHHRKH